jgi:trk system potassium uptake protein TrkA
MGGAGEVGRHLAGLLSQRGHDIVLIDKRRDVLAQAEQALDVQALAGDLVSRRVLAQAQAGRADAFIAVTGSDDANLLGAALAKAMGASVAVAKIDKPELSQGEGGAEHGVLGVDHLLYSTRLSAAEILTLTERSRAPFVWGYAAGSVQVALWSVGASHAAVGRLPDDLGLPRAVRVGGVARAGFVRAPQGASRLEPGDQLLLGGPPEEVASALGRLRGGRDGRRHVVVGGSKIGVILAATLASRGHRVELVEPDPERSEVLAAQLDAVQVLRGDPTDLGFLRDIRFHEADSVLSVTRQEEVNLITTLLVRQQDREGPGVMPHTYVSVHRQGYSELCRSLGIEGAVGSFEVLARAISEAIAPPGIVCSHPLPDLAWVVAHLRAPALLPGAPSVGEIAWPVGVALLAVSRREQVLAPSPDLGLFGGDELVVACPARELAAVELAVRALGQRSR